MTYEEFINSLVPGVQYYDDFRDNGLGAGVPNGWTKMCGQTPTIVADVAAFGGKAVKLMNVGTVPTALSFDAIGPDATKYEILMRFRTDSEYTKQCPGSFDAGLYQGSTSCEPDGPPAFGGPGGRFHYAGGILRAIGGRGSNRSAGCSADMYWGFGPCASNYRPAGGVAQYQDWQIVASRDTGVFEVTYDGQNRLFFSGSCQLFATTVICAHGGGAESINCPDQGQFGVPGTTAGLVGVRKGNTSRYGLMRFRIGRGSGGGFLPDATQIKWWPSDKTEPLAWLDIESDVLGALYPGPAGYLGILHVPHPNMSSLFTPATFIDYVSVSLDPDNHSAAMPPDQPIASCPLPNGEVDVSYKSTVDPLGLYQNP